MNVQNSVKSTDVPKSSEKWPTMKEIVDPKGSFVPKWNVIFIISCLFAVLLDPLFLYIPLINEDMKCLRMDRHLKIAALVLRSLTDLCYMLNIFFQFYRYNNCSALGFRSCSSISSFRSILLNIAKTMSHSYIVVDIFAVLPLPQVAVLVLLSKTRGSASLMTLMNFLVLVQYMPRVFRIYLSCKESSRISREETPLWIKGVLNLFLYILASHVLGAFWYFFAVQRITTCWQNACRKENGCEPSNFHCRDYHTLRNITFLSDSCPIDPANAKLFDFGMFLDVLQLGILGSTNYPEKFAKCFWWGLQNLSSLGSNLPLSIHTWENLFAAFVSVIGLLLFLYLIGNLQTYMQLDVARVEDHRWKMRIKKKMDRIDGEVEEWVAQNYLPSNKKSDIMAKVEVEFKENRDVVVQDIMSILPPDLQAFVKGCMPLSRLRKVPLLRNMDEAALIKISEYLQPMKYREGDIIIQEDEPLKMMIFIVDGLVSIKKRGASSTLQRGAGQVYGEQVLCWPPCTSFQGKSHESAIAIGDVDVLVLMATDMEHVGCEFRSEFGKHITLLSDYKWAVLDTDLVAMLRTVPKLETMESQVLEAISLHLRPKTYKLGGYQEHCATLTYEGQAVRRMVFVRGGSLYSEDECFKCKAGDFFGEELLDWVLDSSFPTLLPVSTYKRMTWYLYEDGSTDVDVLVLSAEDLATVVSEYRSHFSRVITPQTSDLLAAVTLHYLKRVPMFRHMDEGVLKEISKHMKHRSCIGHETVLVEKHKPLEMMFVLLNGGKRSVRKGYARVRDEGDFFGLKLVHWITNWASHTNFPAKLPLSPSNGVICNYNGGLKSEVGVIWADDLKRIVRKFRSEFMKQTTLPIDSEGQLATFDPLTMLKNAKASSLFFGQNEVPILENMDEEVLKAICSHLKPMKYSDDSPDGRFIYNPRHQNDKMFFIKRGLVTYRKKYDPRCYHYSGNYFGEELLEWAFDASFDGIHEMRWPYQCVGEVEVLVLMAQDLAKVVSQFKTHFVRHSDSD